MQEETTPHQEVGLRIRRERERQLKTREWLAAATDSTLRSVGSWERGETLPRYLGKVAEALGINLDDLDPEQGILLHQATDGQLIGELADRLGRKQQGVNNGNQNQPQPWQETGRPQFSSHSSTQPATPIVSGGDTPQPKPTTTSPQRSQPGNNRTHPVTKPGHPEIIGTTAHQGEQADADDTEGMVGSNAPRRGKRQQNHTPQVVPDKSNTASRRGRRTS